MWKILVLHGGMAGHLSHWSLHWTLVRVNAFFLIQLASNYIKSTQDKKLVPNALRFTYWSLKSNEKKLIKEHQTLIFQFFINKSSILILFVLFFHVVCKISNFNVWTAKYLAQASCTELTLITWKMMHQKSLKLHLRID